MSIERRIDPFMMSVLKSRFEAIVREMTLVVQRASRSAVIKNARDFSCAIVTIDNQLVTTEDALAIHVMSMDHATKSIGELFDDIKPGDMFLNNSPYHGGTHHADFIIAMPVFYQGEALFWAVALSHHADVGAPVPSTYLPFAKTIYEEGVHFPCVRLVENYQEKKDIIRIGQAKIRVPELWLGDLRAQMGACLTGEKRIGELFERYGREDIMNFVQDWFDYGERMAIAEIQKLPAGTWHYETAHDPVPGVYEESIPVRVTMTVKPEEGEIIMDVRDNIDNVAGGINLTENTTTGSCRIGVFNNLADNLPHNEGAKRRVKVLMREGSVVGKPKYPAGTSVATTNVNDRLITASNCVFSGMGAPYGQAEGGGHLPAGIGVISGHDPARRKDYVNQIFLGYAGGGALCGHDGWLTYCGGANGGLISLDSVEVDESMYPIVIEKRGVIPDSQGFGEYEGAPGVGGVFYPIDHQMTLIYAADGTHNPPQGVNGGLAAKPSYTHLVASDNSVTVLPAFYELQCAAGQKVAYTSCGGGGYGDPLERKPESVARSVNRGWLSAENARNIYKVALNYDENECIYVVDTLVTQQLRENAAS
ncbi:hydantoinase B/oxoprolinase family protein [Brenneria goodwinii]|uniref:N-methylhydantoinase B n=1 Tax=Brenneria goodwinii TaxID=1109412 RepID=A0A0G4JPX5_9GAMM|nr:hydantoinase B/oxoprolinase family protein [Brenneria goodwinii]CPR13987.1 N-methylhydantoinase B [Brenneria goodwinii]